MVVDLTRSTVVFAVVLFAMGALHPSQAANFGKAFGNAADAAAEAGTAASKSARKLDGTVPSKPTGPNPKPKPNYKKPPPGEDLAKSPPKPNPNSTRPPPVEDLAKSPPKPKPNSTKPPPAPDPTGTAGGKRGSDVADAADTPAVKPEGFFARHGTKLNMGLMAVGIGVPMALPHLASGMDEPDDGTGGGANPPPDAEQQRVGGMPGQSQGYGQGYADEYYGQPAGGGAYPGGQQASYSGQAASALAYSGSAPVTQAQPRQDQVAMVRSWFAEPPPPGANPPVAASQGALAWFRHVSQSYSNDQFLFDGPVGSLEACAGKCLNTTGCAAFTYAYQNTCTLFPRGTTWLAATNDYQAYEIAR